MNSPKKIVVATADQDSNALQGAFPEWVELGLKHAQAIGDMLYSVLEGPSEAKASGVVQELMQAAENLLTGLSVDGHASVRVTEDGALWNHVDYAKSLLEGAWYAAQHGPNAKPPLLYQVVLPAALDYARGLVDALVKTPDATRLRELEGKPFHCFGWSQQIFTEGGAV